MATSTAIGEITTSGIQDISAFLPLLGTEQCEEHVSSALERGFFYAAGSPISIFGSLGIIKAGFTAFWISVDKPPWHGPRQLRNAGFLPKGVMGKLAYALDTDDSIYVAEDNLRSILRRYSTINVKLDLRCWAWVRWNLLLSLSTIGFGSIGLTPYIYLIRVDLGQPSFSRSWLYPMLRVYGCVLITIMIQLIIQLRVLVVVHNRLRFHAINSWFQENGSVPPVSWNTEMRAEESLAKLASDLTSHSKINANGNHSNCQYLHGELVTSDAVTRSFSSFQLSPPADNNRRITNLDKLKILCIPTLLLALCRILLLGGIAAAGIGYLGCFGLIQAGNLKNVTGPGTWLAVEVTLCIIRLAIWASNPAFDDAPPPIAIRKGEAVTYNIGWMLDDVTSDDLHAVVIGIDETADPDVPKLKCAVSDAQSVKAYLENSLAVPAGQAKLLENPTLKQVREALENMATDKTIRHGAPIVIYLASHAMYDTKLTFLTSEFKRDAPGTGLLYSELLDLIQTISDNKGNNIQRAAKTVILDTCHAGSFGRNARFDNDPSAMDEVPNEEASAESIQIRKAVLAPKEKSTPMNGASTGRKNSFAGNTTVATTSEYLIGYSSHVLLAACSDTEGAAEIRNPRAANAARMRRGGAFTQCLLHQLENTETDAFKRLTYRGLIDNLRSQLERYSQTPVVSGNFQNRLLFNGLLARKRLGRGASQETSVILISTDFDTLTTDPEKI